MCEHFCHSALHPIIAFALSVTEYLDGTTQNILVIGTNQTMNSDLRVFDSDGNSTMKR